MTTTLKSRLQEVNPPTNNVANCRDSTLDGSHLGGFPYPLDALQKSCLQMIIPRSELKMNVVFELVSVFP